MNQLITVIKREILLKIKTKSFYMIVLVSPILFLIPVIVGLFNSSHGKINSKQNVGVYSKEISIIKDTIEFRGIKFFPVNSTELDEANDLLGILEISKEELLSTGSSLPVKFFIQEDKLFQYGATLKDVEAFVNQKSAVENSRNLYLLDSSLLRTPKLKNLYPISIKNNESKAKSLATSIAFILGMLIYITLILFNNSILRSVVEEKSNRLVEVLSIFVKPINLMLGKIIGLGFLSLIQLIMWVFVFYIYLKIVGLIETSFFNTETDTSGYVVSLIDNLSSLPLSYIFIFLPIFFILGFLFNGAITTITAIYSSSYNVTYLSFLSNMLNIISIYVAMFVAISPESGIAKVSLYIPFLSYLTAPTLLPYGIPINSILISLLILLVCTSLLLKYSGILFKKSIFPEGKRRKIS